MNNDEFRQRVIQIVCHDPIIRRRLQEMMVACWPHDDQVRPGQIVTCQEIPLDIYVIDVALHKERYYEDFFYGVPLTDYDKNVYRYSFAGSDPGIYHKNMEFWPIARNWLKRPATKEELLKATARCKVEFYRGYLKKLLKSRL